MTRFSPTQLRFPELVKSWKACGPDCLSGRALCATADLGYSPLNLTTACSEAEKTMTQDVTLACYLIVGMPLVEHKTGSFYKSHQTDVFLWLLTWQTKNRNRTFSDCLQTRELSFSIWSCCFGQKAAAEAVSATRSSLEGFSCGSIRYNQIRMKASAASATSLMRKLSNGSCILIFIIRFQAFVAAKWLFFCLPRWCLTDLMIFKIIYSVFCKNDCNSLINL